MSVVVREAVADDYEALIEMLQDFSRLANYPHVVKEDTRPFFDLLRTGAGVILVGVIDKKLVAMAVALVSPLPWNKAVTTCEEMAWWVYPEFRNTSIGGKLFVELERHARKRGCSRLSMGATPAFPEHDSVVGVYKKRGYQHTGTTYTKEL